MAGVVVVGSAAGVVTLSGPANAYPAATVTLSGHGYGHGRGMGQWGAFGYAYAGTTWQQIVEHYYAGSAPAPATAQQEAAPTRVAITENDGNDLVVTSNDGFSVAGRSFGGGQYVRMLPVGNGLWQLGSGSSCTGSFADFGSPVSNPEAVPDQNSVLLKTGQAAAAAMAMQLCLSGGNLFVRGLFEATYNSLGSARTVNVLPVEDYVAGVVPNESPAYWGTLGAPGPQGEPWGFQELEAQAVAARSYMLAARGSYGGYADTCDLSCQTYRGLANESPLTDTATLDTSGYVMEFGNNGVPLTTEYSASSGGYSAPEPNFPSFPAVPDAGDAICPPGVNGACNPNHTRTASVPVSSIQSSFPQLGSLVSISITARNGYGDLGGRVESMTLVGTQQNVVVSGDQFAADFNRLSDWFAVTSTLPSPAVAITTTPGSGGYWVNGSDGSVASFGNAGFHGSMNGVPLAKPVVGMAATADGGGYWEVASDGGIFSFGDARFFGSMGGHPLNRPIVGMAATPNGAGYWLVASDGGIFSFGSAPFEGSAGATPLVEPIVGMARSGDGNGYWLAAADGGIFAYGDAPFYGSAAA